MAANDRLIFSLAHVAFQADGSASTSPSGVHGVQNVQINTTYGREDVFELGQLKACGTKETIPAITVSVEKYLDGKPLVYHSATTSTTGADLWQRAANMKPAILKFATFDQQLLAASGTPLAVCTCSGLYIDSLNYSFPLNGVMSETVAFVGSSKIWATGSSAANFFTGQFASGYFGGPAGPDSCSPERRDNLDMVNSVWPQDIPEITGGGVNSDLGVKYKVHLGDISIAANIARTELFEQGRRRAFFRNPQSPIEITTTIGLTANEFMDAFNARDDGTTNLTNRTIKIRTSGGVQFDMGSSNQVQSVNFQNVDVGGNPFGVQFVYTNRNGDLTVTSPSSDPKGYAYT